MTEKYLKAIDEVQHIILQCEMGKLDAAIVDMLDVLTKHPLVLENEEKVHLCLQQLLTAYQSKDFLLVADTLEDDLKSLIAVKGRETT